MARDYHEDARTLCELLDAEELAQVAKTLRDDMVGGCTGTEILMALRYHCRELLGTSKGSAAARALAADLADAIDRALE